MEGHEVDIARDGPSGLRAARDRRPEIVICDIGLPGMDGYEVARGMRADPELRSIHLIALTGYTQPSDVERARAAGFDRHFAKPPDIERLEAALRSA
ncbi:MAG: response regulator [Polyangiaceae bacterium]